MTKLNSVNCNNNLRGKEETEMFLDAKPANPTIVGDTKTLNVTYIESAKQAYKKRKNVYPLCAILLTLVIITWLTALTIVREYQLADLKREVRELRASVEEVKQQYADDQLFDSLKEFEEEANKQSGDDGTDGAVSNKYDKADEDYYFDYVEQDQARPRLLDGDDIDDVDFLGEVMEAKRPENIRFLTEDKDDQLTARSRRSSAYESSDEATTQNLGRLVNRTNSDTRPTYGVGKPFSKVTARSVDEEDDLNYRSPYNDRYRMPAVEKRPLYMQSNPGNMRSNDDRRHYKKVEAVELFDEKDPPRNYLAQSPNLLVAHYHGDANNESKIVGYDSNGRVPHMHEVPFTAWSPAPWLAYNEMSPSFSMVNGALLIPESGIYFVYAQVYYHDLNSQSSYKVMRSNSVNKGAISILQCSVTSNAIAPMKNANTCYTAGAFYLDAGDTIYIMNVAGARYSIMKHDKSFFGLFKLNDGPLV